MSTDLLKAARAAIADGGVAPVRKTPDEEKKRKDPKGKKSSTYAAKVATADAVETAKSKYTGLPKGPGSAAEQDALLKSWIADGCKFPSSDELNTLVKDMSASGNLMMPMSRRQVDRRAGMIAVMRKHLGKTITDQQLCALALARGKWRRPYWIVCSCYGYRQREDHSTTTSKLTDVKDGDADDTKQAKLELKELADALVNCQRKWQAKVEALRKSEAPLLDVMARLTQRCDELRDALAVPKVIPPVSVGASPTPARGGRGSPTLGSTCTVAPPESGQTEGDDSSITEDPTSSASESGVD